MAVAFDWWPVSLYGDGTLPQSSASNDTPASGITLLVFLGYENPNITGVSDNKGNTFTLLGTVQGGFSGYASARSAVYICENATGGAGHVITANGSTGAYAYLSMYCVAVSGVELTSGVDGTIAQVVDSGSTPWDGASYVTSNANNVLFLFADVMGAGTETLSESTGFTKQVSEPNGAAYWSGAVFTREVTSTGTYTPSVTSAGSATEMMLHVLGLKVASSGNTAALTGAGATTSTGTLGVTRAPTITGAAATTAAGTVAAVRSKALVGQSAALAAGNVTFSSAAGATLSGIATTAAAGTLAAADTKALTGVSASASVGTVSSARSITGASVTAAVGTVAATTARTLSGHAATMSAGVLTVFGVQPTLGAHTLLVHRLDEGEDPSTSDPITTQAAGSSILVIQANHVSNSGVGPPVDSESNTFTSVHTREAYVEFPNYGVESWVCEQATGGSSYTVTVQQNGTATEELDLYVVEITGAGRLQDYSVIERAAGTDLISAAVTTTGPATLVGFWFGDSLSANHTAVPRDGFTVFDSILAIGDLIQSAGAAKNVTSAGDYTIQWDETPDQGAILLLFAFEYEPGPNALTGITATVSAGSVAATKARALTGQSAAASAGSVVYAGAPALTGVAATTVAGTLSTAANIALTGGSSTTAAGSVSTSVDGSASLTGSAATAVAGVLGPASVASVTGASVAASPGTVSSSVGGQAALTGATATSTPGSVAGATARALTGSLATAAAGTVTPASFTSVAITGAQATTQIGSVSKTHGAALTGSTSAAAAGTLATTAQRGVTGAVATTVAGTVTATVSQGSALTGAAATTQAGSVTAVNADRTAALTGSEATAAVGSLSPARAAALTGYSLTTFAGVLGQGSNLTGASATATPGSVLAARTAALQGITASMSAGSVTGGSAEERPLTGISATASPGSVFVTPRLVGGALLPFFMH